MSKKSHLIKAAVVLFARQGYEGTTTAQIAAAAGVTEPVIYYNFKNKAALFAHILETTLAEYFIRMDAVDVQTTSAFDRLANLIRVHFAFTDDFPDETYMIVTACPAKLGDAAHVCARLVAEQRRRLTEAISGCLAAGIESGEFIAVPVAATTGMLVALVNGLLRRRGLQLDKIEGLQAAAIAFCRRSLVKAAQGDRQ